MRKEVWDEGKSYGAGIDDGDEEDDEDGFLWLKGVILRGDSTRGRGKEKLEAGGVKVSDPEFSTREAFRLMGSVEVGGEEVHLGTFLPLVEDGDR